MNQQPIFILGAHKSGTTMLRNMLSGHPDLFVIPFESHVFQLSDWDVDYEYRKNKKQGLSIKQIESNFKDWIKLQNEAVDPMGDTFVTGKLNVDAFNQHFCLKEGDTQTVIFEKYMSAVHQCLGLGDLDDNKRVVEKSVENAEFAVELSKMYPQARFIHIVRNPYANFVSLRKYKSVGVGYPLLNRMVKTIKNSYHYLEENPKQIEHYLVVRYEDILTDTERVMQEVAGFIGIPFNEKLLFPSHLGEQWGGNSTSGKKFKSVSSVNLDEWKNEILPIEVKCVNSVAKEIIHSLRYPFITSNGSFIKKKPEESLLRFIFNRLCVLLL
ncbi:MAG: hypothetical protein GC178_05105 [Flavobacteriales bacterium]|nr:hypothetical protein [Flavobacteriales bacterium]